MKVYLIRFDGGTSIVEAPSFGEAVRIWREAKRIEWGVEFQETDEPDSVELIHDEPVLRVNHSSGLLEACQMALAATEDPDDHANLPSRVLVAMNEAVASATGGVA